MTDFGQLFIESKGKPIVYKENTLTLADRFPVSDGDILIASIEKTKSDYRQGISIDITGYCEYEDKVFKQGKGIRMLFWEDTAPQKIKLKIFAKKDFVWVKNIWEAIDHRGTKYIDSGHNGAAMIVEEIENGRRYRCNDGTPDDDFDDIIFTVQRM